MKNATKELSLVLVVIMVIMSLVTVNTDVFAETNVAQGKAATASSALSGYGAGKANDGDTTSRWCATSASYPQWLRIDLGQNYSITSTSITFAPSGSTFKYKIEVSTDGSTFTTKTDKTSTNYSGTQNDNFTATARYIRITLTGSGTGDWASIAEIKAMGTASGPQDPPGATDLAQAKTASASSVESGSPASNANDGNTSTSWCASSGSFNQWLKVDLGNANNSIESTSITFPSGQSFKYKIEVSSDGSSFTTKINKTSANYTGTQNDNFTASSVRYVMVTITGSGTSDWASIAEIKVMGTASGGPGNPEQNLLTGYDWSHFSGATVGTSGNVTITPIDRKIRPKTTGKWYLNPPINLAGPRLQFTGDFDVTAKMNITANPGKYAYLDLYGTVPICYDEWRIDGKNVRIGIKNGTIEVWINMAKQTYSKTGLSGTVTVSMRREGGILNFYVDGTKIGGSSDSVFTSGKLYIGADAEIGGGYSIDALTCAGASLTVADNYTDLIKTYPAKAGSLRDYASQLSQPFWIGTAIQANALLSDPNYGKTLAEEFNMVTSEMDMKWQEIHPMENQYAWADADAMVDFCYKNNIRFRGHCLVWHEALPTWVWDIYNSGDYVRLKQVLMDHITTVVTRYKGKIQEWDVLNEIFSDDDPSNNTYGLRDAGDAENNPSIWYRAFGPSIYIDAIKKVKEIDPACEVWINDYGIEQLGMRYKLANMASFINYAIAAGAQIDGVGFQAHNYDPVGDPSTASDTLNSMQYIVAQTGLKVRISELDVDGASTRSTLFSDKLDVCTNFIENPNCRSLGIWGFTDKYSSMSGPTNNGTSGTNYTSPNWGVNYADGLIFNTNYAKKSAYDAMLSILELKR